MDREMRAWTGPARLASILLAGLTALLAAPAVAQPQDAARCTAASIHRMAGRDVEIESASLVPASGEVPAHCAIRGYLRHGTRIGFSAALPIDWNGKFLF